MPLEYNISLTGDCQSTNSGAMYVSFTGASPYYITWINPTTYASATTSTSYFINSLSAGSYSFNVTDTDNINTLINFNVTSSSTLSISSTVNTTCGDSNGTLTVTTPTNYGTNTINLYQNGILLSGITTQLDSYTFNNLGEGVYYATCTNYGGCFGTSENTVIYNSPTLDYGFYIIDNPSCSLTNGKVYITGLTGSSPFTYQWSGLISGDTTNSFITGLTNNNYSCTVTDSYGCSVTKSATVNNALPISIINTSQTPPSCSGATGSLTYSITGGTGPYYYLLSNGDSQVTYDTLVTFNNLPSGSYTLTVTDVALCQKSLSVNLLTPNSFSVIGVNKGNATCGFTTGFINVSVVGGATPYTYTLTNLSGYSEVQTTSLNSTTFSSLSANTYSLNITDSLGTCSYTSSIDILNENPFTITTTPTSTYCYRNKGQITIDVTEVNPSTATTNFYTYSLSNGSSSFATTAQTYTFSGLTSGPYTVTVSNQNTCNQVSNVSVDGLTPINFVLYSTGCLNGSGGTMSAVIFDEGPFDFTWSDNVNGQTGVYISGLTAGTYTLTLSGVNNCNTTQQGTVDCTPSVTTSTTTVLTGGTSVVGSSFLDYQMMLIQGFYDLTSGHDYCKLNSAVFKCVVELDGMTYSNQFYTTTSLDNYPNISGFSTALSYVLSTIPYLDTVYVDPVTNQVTIESAVVGGVEYYKDETVTVSTQITYNISCLT